MADLGRPVKLLRCGPSFQSFAATAKSADRRIHTTRTKCAFAASTLMAALGNVEKELYTAATPKPEFFHGL